MATQTKSKSKNDIGTVKIGTKATFVRYSDTDVEPILEEGSIVSIIGYDADNDTYTVEDGEGRQDNVFLVELNLSRQEEAPAKSKSKAKSKAKPKAEEVEAEEVADKPKAKTKPKAKAEEEAAPTETKKRGRGRPRKEDVEEVVLPKYKMTPSVKAALDEAGGDALAAAEAEANKTAHSSYTTGGLLAYIKRNNIHTTIVTEDEDGNEVPAYAEGLKGFNQYVEDTLGIQPRKADWLVNLYEKFSQITTEAKIAKIGWTKLRELLPLPLSKDNVDEWLDKAKNETTSELHESVKEYLVDSGEKTHGKRDLAKKVVYKLVAFEDQANVIKEAIARAKEELEENASDSDAMFYIVSDWLNFQTDGDLEAE